jgi:hypothetical protein
VTVCGETIELKQILPGQGRQGAYRVRGDSHYDVRIEFQSGRALHKEIGYVTNGVDFDDEIVVTDAGIDIVRRSPGNKPLEAGK